MDAPESVYRQLLRRAAGRLTGQQRRLFIAEVTRALCDGNPRRSERQFGWGRQTAEQGLHELDSGIRCLEDFRARGRKRTEDQWPQLAQDIRELVDPKAQADPQFRSPLLYTRITAGAVRQALIDHKGYRDADLPTERTFGNILNRLGYRLRRVQKTKPLKKVRETDALFANVDRVHRECQADPATLELSVDTKAKVGLGDYSRDGQARSDSDGRVTEAWDHDPPAQKK
jgi:hypothetical protein